MERFGLYDKLTSIPLFMGMSRHELEQIISRTKFNFRKVTEGEIVVRQGNKCGFLAMLIDGTVETIASADDYAYEVHEFLSGPMVLQFDGIFGRIQLFTRTYKAASSCNFIILDKNEVLNLASNSFIFRLNLLSLISTALQKKAHEPWQTMPKELSQDIIQFMAMRCTYPAGKKIFKIKMQYLATKLHTSRLAISRELNKLQKNGLITLSRGQIIIDALERLIATTR